MRVYSGKSFSDICEAITIDFVDAPDVHVGEWQAIQADIPQADTVELEDVSFEMEIGLGSGNWPVEWLQDVIRPNMPWAEEHFQERVSGIPHNPPPSHVRWPYAQKSNNEHMANQQFSHTYPERFWPKWAGQDNEVHQGIRYPWGDLSDVVRLLQERPGTRQAYLPVWFPEDTGAVSDQRVPCTLGYHFLIRDNKLKVVYYIRSCDFFRHFRDDVYMAGRLAQWIADQLPNVVASKLVMHISSLHIFSAERGIITSYAQEIMR